LIGTVDLSRRKFRTAAFCALFLLPALAFYVAFIIVPVFVSFGYSLTQWNGVGKKLPIGFANYRTSFIDENAVLIIKNTAIFTLAGLLEQIPFGLVFGFLLSRGTRGYKLFRTSYYLPVVIAPVAIGTMFRLLFNGEIGMLPRVLHVLGLDSWNREWLSDPRTVLATIIIPCVWQYNGFYVVIFVARMLSIPDELFESARIDGANQRQIFLRIVLPQVSYMIVICAVFIVSGSLKAFDIPFIMTKGGPGYASSILSLFMYRKAFEESRFGFGSAVAIEILAIALALSLLIRAFGRREEGQL
jgi:raffinose/stachyose/melibiose transport system permease protein